MLHKNGLLMLLLALMTACSGGNGETVASFVLAVSMDGPGTGSVTSSPAGITCGTDCAESYNENTLVTLTASAATGSVFSGWSGACSGSDSCSVMMDTARSVTATFVEYSVDCSAYAVYAPGTDPEIRPSTSVPATTTVIVMHGKADTPLNPELSNLYTALANGGYDVVAPYMPWSSLDWGTPAGGGAMCEAMNYIDSLAAQQAAKNMRVIVAGHSMGGAHALIYAATAPADEVKAIIALAPGHFPQLELPLLALFSTTIADSLSASIALAENMVAGGTGDDTASFYTLFPDLNNPLLQISATASVYLSYHALDQFPDINHVLPVIKLPVLWLAGQNDDLTSLYDMTVLFSRISSQDSVYQSVSGGHLDMLSSSATPMMNWMFVLGL